MRAIDFWDIRYQPERGKPADGRSFNAFLTDEEMATAAQRTGANSGTIAARGSCFHAVMDAWREIDESEPLRDSGYRGQASWNALLLRMTQGSTKEEGHLAPLEENGKIKQGERDAPPPWTAEPFPAGEVQFPNYLDPH